MKTRGFTAIKQRIEEKAFRRGYQHGWLFAVNALASGATTDEALAFALKELQDWRYGRSNGRAVNPPALNDGR